MHKTAACKNIQQHNSKRAPGLDKHVVGGARIGNDKKTSIVDKWCRLHDYQNVFAR